MSRQNKVNPGTYTQRGRLTQDDAARELRKQSAIASPHTSQPVRTKTRPRLAPARMTATMVAPSNAEAKAATAKTARTRNSKRATGNVQTGKARTRAMKRTTARPTRTAVLARNVGGGGAAPRPTRKRRKR
jgi:hypothetical protein